MSQVLKFATKSFEPVGLIILVTGAGGVFGRVLEKRASAKRWRI